jgi:hypothetical protein
MRLISFAAAISFAFVSAAGLAQQSPPTTGDTIGHPPPLPGPPPLAEPSAAPVPENSTPAPVNSQPPASQPTAKGYTGAYAPAGTPPPTPYYSGPLPPPDTGPGLNVTDADGSTRTVKAVPCSAFARETDGFTTCVGIPDRKERGTRKPRRY